MSKKSTKKPFKWDTEESLGYVQISDRSLREASRVSRNGKDYILLTELKYFAKEGVEDWYPVKGFTVPAAAWEAINDLAQKSLEENPPEEEEEEGGEE